MEIENSNSEQNEYIYYVLPNQKVNMAEVNSYKIRTEQVQHDLSTQGIVNSLKYRHALKYLGKQYSQLIVPCTPAKEPQLVRKNINDSNQQSRTVPDLVKVPNNQKFKAYASGKRSALLQNNGKFFRYKGCGNLLEGFTLSNNQPRGCHYFHTAKRQLLMTNQINKILQKQIGIQSANKPLFAFQYNHQQILNLGLKCQAQFIGKYCCVFQTVGDRRIGTHLISPLQILFLNLCNLDNTKWFELFQKQKRIDSNQPVQFLANWLFLQPGQSFLQKLFELDQNQNYIPLNLVNLENISVQIRSKFIENILQKLVKSNQQKQFIKQKLLNLEQNIKEIIEIIVQKTGYQMGQIKRIFCDHNLNWGYYNDHGTLWHCNAHLNNFVSTIPQQNKQFLLPLDFDLAFFKQQFISIDLEQCNEPIYGKYDENMFQSYLCSQYQAMQLSVSGIQVMSNFQYSIDYDSNKKMSPLQPVRMARIVFRDTLLKYFRYGMRKNKQVKQEINKKWNQNIAKIKQIVKICLIISQDFQT